MEEIAERLRTEFLEGTLPESLVVLMDRLESAEGDVKVPAAT